MPETATVSERIFLQPGELVLANGPARVRTVLGSCVAITMRAPRTGLAAVAHCLLPSASRESAPLGRSVALRYVDATIDLMLAAFASRGVSAAELEVKLFGGSDNPPAGCSSGGYRVGGRNIEMALRVLSERGIRPLAAGVGGRAGRVIDFDSASGEVLVQRLPPSGGPE